MKKFLALFGSLIITSQLFAVSIKDSSLNGLNGDTLKPIQTVFLIMKIGVIVLLIFMLFKTIFQMWQADPQQRGSILMKNALFIVIGVVILLAIFNIPKIFGLDNIMAVEDSGSAVIRVIEIDKDKRSVIDEFDTTNKTSSVFIETTEENGFNSIKYSRMDNGKDVKKLQNQWVDMNNTTESGREDVLYHNNRIDKN